MTATVVEGKALASALREKVAAAVAAAGIEPTLAVVLAQGEEGAAAYTRSLAKAGGKVGLRVDVHEREPRVEEAASLLAELNADPSVHGIILQTPFAGREGDAELAELIALAKDVDGQSSASLGLVWAGRPRFVPSTAAAAIHLLEANGVEFVGAEATVVGRSPVVGKPAAALLVARHATVTICHTRTRDLAAACRRADILVAAAGAPELIKGEMIKPGAAVIDCGYNFTEDGRVVGDVAFEEAAEVASLLTPAQGGVGPVTTALLLMHVARAAGAEIAA
ncbi:MAG: bifunctional 5,10-methylenetetrahydrofolate dehydrogenase/5,10-methenyltetrahydrofolate cyclohydrolase [Candidatus Coatesbacteria bacterium]|nr:MAG: bifunctional 5,10-methylenetetrahydrofolate dehydrogenase/5,10-methenyltetrahydrofolate cyclohydrolase [Candidatus Coatesbacteria bacterium]